MAAIVLAAVKRREDRKQERIDRQNAQLAGVSMHQGGPNAPRSTPVRPGSSRVSTIDAINELDNPYASRDSIQVEKDEKKPVKKEKKIKLPPIIEERKENARGLLAYQHVVYTWYNSSTIQIVVALLILVNFVVNAAEAQVPDEGDHPIFKGFEIFFTVIFTLELVLNLFAHWCGLFWASGWNWFDFIVVAISLLSLVFAGLPGVSTLRLMRAFRVFRLFKRLESLRKIIKALESAIPGCSNAFSIVILVNAIYSILGVEFFREHSPEYFRTFMASMLTMFQVMTGDSWAMAIARPIIDDWPHAAIFFVTYVLIANIMLVNVVIAVLLDKMVQPDSDSDSDEEDALDDDDEEDTDVSVDLQTEDDSYVTVETNSAMAVGAAAKWKAFSKKHAKDAVNFESLCMVVLRKTEALQLDMQNFRNDLANAKADLGRSELFQHLQANLASTTDEMTSLVKDYCAEMPLLPQAS
ncbi:hypothetical protein CYMTET_42543 [Cymbomonas tetramitiformis]|uniref:Ion transport domain-containing protein n=1 Tax=Cymbomonas tetramitiformis TaxID=36881 RepID=A0AAE0C402_9CHLO|nr:hypothetical protein CYMTET_42543 [Cymbomonas tetramitiformis]|eukprot:gene8189-9726_t